MENIKILKEFLSLEKCENTDKLNNEILAELRKLQGINITEYPLISGLEELLVFLKQNGYVIAIATGSDSNFVETILKFHSIRNYFDVIVTGEQFEFSKPDPKCFQVAFEKLGITPSNAIIIEDSISGIRAAKKMNCRVFGLLTYLSKKNLSEADLWFENHFGILKFLRNE